MKVKVILLRNVENVGQKGNVVDVAKGFARNFLLRKGFAQVATKSAMTNLTYNLDQADRRSDKAKVKAEEIKEQLEAKTITIEAKAGPTGTLFGAVTRDAVARAIKREFQVVLGKKSMSVDNPIKSLGMHVVHIDLHHDVKADVNLEVVQKSGK
ncbi:MAG TPA: 50S ribosomal protein L9 [Caldisericia bacterium]|nr:50S ribosomal protein L9 [Caldisericia bacterium]HPF48983.1 50S ribosomal protein L9 [Caldisericia bacterium]HPI83153.1 50S ribosomal protein L9 [Caldisericia bacterium]HPQ92380.1 50S ribosomal protein L9 [Caldisericia bacterium]HRV74522.1 50S ribosomal protein L9 [Caldisericia bacterium]